MLSSEVVALVVEEDLCNRLRISGCFEVNVPSSSTAGERGRYGLSGLEP